MIWDQGVVTPLAAADVSSDGRHATFAYPGEAGWAFYAGAGFLGADCFGDTATPEPLVLDLSTAGIERVRDPVLAHAEQAFVGDRLVGETFLTRDVGAEGFYDRLYLNDPDRIATVRSGPRAAAFLGEAWMGLPPYHVILSTALPGDPGAIPPTWGFLGEGFLVEADPSVLAFQMDAVAAGRRAGDRVLIDLAPSFRDAAPAPLPVLDAELA